MAINVAADPIAATVTPLGTWLQGLLLGEAITVPVTLGHPFYVHSPPEPRNPDLDLYYNAQARDSAGVAGRGVVKLTVSFCPSGAWDAFDAADDTVIVVTLTLARDSGFAGAILNDGTDTVMAVTVDLGATDTREGPIITLLDPQRNWVKWSDIGHLDFTIWKDNVAGERPMDWPGWVYDIRKLGGKVAVYGQGGVSLMTPAGNAFGLQTLLRIGLKGPQSVCGTDTEHYFIDQEGQLWRLSDGLELLDYKEWLAPMTSPVLSLDLETGLIFICDGQYGFVYSPRSKSMGEGPVNITGVGTRNGDIQVCASGTISTPAFNICTDILDFGSRHHKTVRSIEFGTDMAQALSASLDYRRDKSAAWLTTSWRTVNKHGIAYITCFGQEFRVRAKSAAYEAIELDYINIAGQLHDY